MQPAILDRLLQRHSCSHFCSPYRLNPGNTASLHEEIDFRISDSCLQRSENQGQQKRGCIHHICRSREDARIEQQKQRLTGLRFRGEEECCHSSYDITLNMLEKSCLLYLGPEKFPTRRHKLLQKKPSKEISIDQSQLVVKEKQSDLTCPTVTELDVSNALKRRALAFDLVGVCTYEVMAAYHADLLDHLHTPPPPGYSAVSVQQILRADKAAFMFLAERMTSLKRNATNQLPLDLQLPSILSQPNVAFHLLPLSGGTPKAPSAAKASNPKKRSRSPRKQSKAKEGQKVAQVKIVAQTFQRVSSTKPWRHLRSNKAYNLPNGCSKAKAGESCSKAIHLCAEPGCFKPHSLQDHR